MSSSMGAGGRGAPGAAVLLPGAYAGLAAALVATVICLPDHAYAGWCVFGAAAVIAALAGVWIHPRAGRTPLWWGAAALGCLFAAQLSVLAGIDVTHEATAAVFDVFVFAAGVAAVGALSVAMSRRVPGWDSGFLLDLVVIVAGAAAVAWMYLVEPYIVPGSLSTLRRQTLTGYPTLCLVLVVFSTMLWLRAGRRRRGIALTVAGVAGLVFSNLLLLAARIDDVAAHGFWGNAAWAGSGWLVFQGCWASASLHTPDERCPGAAARRPRRPMSLTRLLLLIAVALADPLVEDIQSARGRVAPVGHFPVVGGVLFLAVTVRLGFIGAEHLRSLRRLRLLVEAQQRISGAQSAAGLAQEAADVAAGVLGGGGEACVALFAGGRLAAAGCETPQATLRLDPARWRALIGDWPPAGLDADARVGFLKPEEFPFEDGARPDAMLACPVNTSRSHRGKPVGMILAAGSGNRVTGAADVLALLAGQVGQSLERIRVVRSMAQRHLKAMTANVSDAILVVGEDGVVSYANAAAGALFGNAARRGTMLSELVGPAHAGRLSVSAQGGLRRWTLPGAARIVEALVDDRRADPTVGGFVLTLHDITKLSAIEQEMRQRATHDQETGLENRLAFTARLTRAAADGDVERGVLVVAMDDLPEIAEEFGGNGARDVVGAMARRLSGAFEPEQAASVARIDSSTLALLVSGAPELPPPDSLLARIRSVGSEPVIVEDRAVTASLSGGFADWRGDSPAEEVIEDALRALHAAQRSSPRGVAVFTTQLRESSREQAEMRAGLNEALLEGAFEVHYQPVVSLDDRRPVSAEALVRWRKPDGTLVRPDVFIPFAEQTGQIVPLGDWVLRRSLEDYRRWPHVDAAGNPAHPRVNVNVSPVQLREPDFVARLHALLGEAGLPPASLVIEVTESGIVEQVETLVQVRSLGVGVAMDDFGTGYSSLSSLRRLPISTVKIDKAFVDGIATDPLQYALVEGIVRLAGELGLVTVAEGVETEEQHARLRAAGCRCGQGYLYSRPIQAAEYEQWLLSAGAE
jgi:EAL domain-containing protein (putative c-di-GMP-specific phosphodiesterase class I)/GGDEF domain-containing protein/PAS domain-containing protein